MINKIIVFLLLIVTLNGCASEWQNNSNDTNKINNDKAYCKSLANAMAPIYICRNPLMCAQDETPKVIQSLSSNTGHFNKCMFDRGNTIKQ